MANDTTPLHDEITALRAEVRQLQREHHELLRLVGVMPLDEDEEWPRYLHCAAETIAVRNDPNSIPIIIKADGDKASIIFRDKNHQHRLALVLDECGPRIEMRNAGGDLTFQLSEAEDGTGQMCVCDGEGRPRAGLRVNESGGLVNVTDSKGRSQAFLLGTPAGGEVFAVNAMHKAAATMKATNRGGVVSVHEPSGQLMGCVAATTDTGSLTVHGPHGAVAAGLFATEEGGGVVFSDVDGEFKAKLP